MSYAQYRCAIHGNWVNSDSYRKCPICGERCTLVQEKDREDAYDVKQSSAKKAELLAEAAAEANAAAEAARAEEAALERRINDSADVLRWDLEHWTDVDLADWGPARELGG